MPPRSRNWPATRTLALLSFLLLPTAITSAADAAAAEGRPRIGLVLSGGGGRGGAHIGGKRALEGFHVPIDSVGRTSNGAVVGGV